MFKLINFLICCRVFFLNRSISLLLQTVTLCETNVFYGPQYNFCMVSKLKGKVIIILMNQLHILIILKTSPILTTLQVGTLPNSFNLCPYNILRTILMLYRTTNTANGISSRLFISS